MVSASDQDTSACEEIPIVTPGAIQPHGLLFVVDPETDVIRQIAGDVAGRTGFAGPVVGALLESVLGRSLAELTQPPKAAIGEIPSYLVTVGPFGERPALAIIARHSRGVTIIEAIPAGPPASAASILAMVRSTALNIAAAVDLPEACELAVKAVRRISGYDRVLVYRFRADATGAVVAEAREPELPAFLHQRYPASDIPKQARELYLRNMIRIIPDVDYRPAPLIPPYLYPGLEPLDMSECILRATAPSHLKYLKNMGVAATMSVSVIVDGALWGLIVCHNTSPRALPFETLEVCRHVGEMLARKLTAYEVAERYRIARAYAEARGRNERILWTASDPVAVLLELGDDIVAVVRADGMAACWKGLISTTGAAPSPSEIGPLAVWLRARMSGDDVFSTDRLPELYAPASAFAAEASGLVAITLAGDHPVLMLWFRKEEVEEIRWAGNPYQPLTPGGPGEPPQPRLSFEPWIETVRGRSSPWDPLDLESALDFAERTTFVLRQVALRDLNASLLDANEKLAAQALTDALTGLANRRAFDQRLRREWSRASRLGTSLALIMIDLDFFKQFNDQYGHGAGDDCLKWVARILEQGRRGADVTARIGGEEFAVLLPDTPPAGAVRVAETLRAELEAGRIPHARSPFGVMTGSFGVGIAVADRALGPESLTLAADAALYDAKESGRNRVVVG